MTTGRLATGIRYPGDGGGGVPNTWIARLPSVEACLRGARSELAGQLDRVLLWAPVAFGLGSAAYLGLKVEPPAWVALVVSAAAICGFVAARALNSTRPVVAIIGLVALAGIGFAAAKIHSDRVTAPIAPAVHGVVSVEGWVVDIATPSESGERLLIAPVRISGLAPDATPARVRLVLPSADGPESLPPPGAPVRIVALLDPPPGPASPGAYDFARDAWFEGIGGVGLAMRPPQLVSLPPPPGALRGEMNVNALRWRVARRLASDIRAAMGPDDGGAAGLAVAVTTSHQDWLAADHREDLRGSGLAHMLAIAGLHTAAISGFAFFACRLLIAAWPWLALRIPAKKVAALAGLIVVASYLVLSGAHPPARRAAITASVAFLAILVDRRAVSLHSLAVAAMIILMIEPEVVVQPGFEMSFCATASLVALAEIWRRPRAPEGHRPWVRTVASQLGRWLLGLTMVSLVAGAATGPFAIQHFNRVANYGVFANLTADFVASVVLMPALALTFIAHALGLGDVVTAPLMLVAGFAARTILEIGHVFASAPDAAISLPSAPEVALAISYLGIVFACLWRGRLRWVGLPMAAAVALWPRPAPPAAWIAADGDDAAVVVRGEETPMKPTARRYAIELWAQRRGFKLSSDPSIASRAEFFCDRKGCLPIGAARPAIAASWTRKAPTEGRYADLCARADFVILRSVDAPPSKCGAAVVLTRDVFERRGSAEIFSEKAGWTIVWSQDIRGVRPWTGSEATPTDSVE